MTPSFGAAAPSFGGFGTPGLQLGQTTPNYSNTNMGVSRIPTIGLASPYGDVPKRKQASEEPESKFQTISTSNHASTPGIRKPVRTVSRLTPSMNRRASHSLFDNFAPEKKLNGNAFVINPNPKHLVLGDDFLDDLSDSLTLPSSTARQLPAFRSGSKYYCRPSMSSLQQLADLGKSLVIKNFTIGKPGVGEIVFHEDINLADLAGQYLDDIIQFEPMCVSIYDTVIAPPSGQGLNVPSKVSLFGVTIPPRYIKDVPRFEAKLRTTIETWGPSIKFHSFNPNTETVKLTTTYFD